MSWILPEVSSTNVSIGPRRLVTKLSPAFTMIRPRAVRVCSMDIDSEWSPALNAQVSTTCCPWVFTTFTIWPVFNRHALPLRAGIVSSGEDAMVSPSGRARFPKIPKERAAAMLTRVIVRAAKGRFPGGGPSPVGNALTALLSLRLTNPCRQRQSDSLTTIDFGAFLSLHSVRLIIPILT